MDFCLTSDQSWAGFYSLFFNGLPEEAEAAFHSLHRPIRSSDFSWLWKSGEGSVPTPPPGPLFSTRWSWSPGSEEPTSLNCPYDPDFRFLPFFATGVSLVSQIPIAATNNIAMHLRVFQVTPFKSLALSLQVCQPNTSSACTCRESRSATALPCCAPAREAEQNSFPSYWKAKLKVYILIFLKWLIVPVARKQI